ncbi:MAG TPA: hypothetical protein VJK53_05260 [Candidatus Paceibacterota bacterium]
MKYQSDKQGSKFLFLAIVILLVYLAAFNFDLKAAYDFTVAHMFGLFN